MIYSIYVTIETLQKMHELTKISFVCDGDKREVESVEDDE